MNDSTLTTSPNDGSTQYVQSEPCPYDSKADTLEHILEVNKNLRLMVSHLLRRGENHDQSKLQEPEKSAFDSLGTRLRGLTYGSEEYRASLRELKPALLHHYQCNSHHPEHYSDGISGMCILDFLEMFCDWLAATKRHADGDIIKSIHHNQGRFGYSDEVKSMLLNTVKYFT